MKNDDMSLTHFMSEMNEKIFLLSFIIFILFFALSMKFIEMDVWSKKMRMLDAICHESCVRLDDIDVIFWWKFEKWLWRLIGKCWTWWDAVVHFWRNSGKFYGSSRNFDRFFQNLANFVKDFELECKSLVHVTCTRVVCKFFVKALFAST
jgi:hypothetical protein